MLKIIPLEDEVQIKTDAIIVGNLNSSSRSTAVENGEVIAVGSNIKNLKKGDKIMFKSWALDDCTVNDIHYYFINVRTLGIKAIIK